MTTILSGHDHRERTRLDTRRVDRRLLLRYHELGDAAARVELIERFMPLACQLARRYQRRTELDDLIQVASLGLMKAVDRFDPSRGTAFSTYAVPTIIGELKRYFRDSGWAVHVPRAMQERAIRLNQASEALQHRLGRLPLVSELAAELHLTSEEVVLGMEAASAFQSRSLDAQLGNSDESDAPTYAESLGTQDGRLDLIEDVTAIAPGVSQLGHREQVILRMRFVEDLTQAEIAERLGLSQMHISRLLRRSLETLRTSTTADRPAA